jgi:large subunit ribosomal protein L2
MGGASNGTRQSQTDLTRSSRGYPGRQSRALHKGAPVAGLLESAIQARRPQQQRSHHDTAPRVADTSNTIDWSISSVTRTASPPKWSAWNTTRTGRPTLPCFAMPTASAATSSLRRALTVGQQVSSGSEAPIKVGNTLPIRNIPVGTTIHCVEMVPGKGAQLARSAGTSVQLLAREGVHAQLRLRSGEIRRVHVECRATIGEVGNEEHSLRSIGKAGGNRWRGVRPTVRGVAMNPIDHPHGGGEGKTASGMHPVSPWGTKTKGYRTRRNKRTTSMIVQRRSKNAKG